MPTTSTTATVDTTASITTTLAATVTTTTTNISYDALNTSHSNQQQQIPNTYLIGPIHNMSTGAGAGTTGTGSGSGGGSSSTTAITSTGENVVIGPQGNNATFIAVTHQQLQQHQQQQLQQSTAHSTTGIGPPATLTSNLLGFVGGIGIASTTAASGGQPVFVTGIATIANNNNNTSGNNNNNNPNDNNNNMDNTSEDSNPVTIYRCRAPIASLDCMEEFSGTGGHLDFGIKL